MNEETGIVHETWGENLEFRSMAYEILVVHIMSDIFY